MATRDSVCIRCDRVDGFPCLLGGKADAQVICVDPALAARQRAPGHPRKRHAVGDRCRRAGRHGGRHRDRRRRRRRGDGALQRRRRGGGRGRGELRGPAAALGERPAPRRPGQRLRRGRPALHAPQQPGPDGGVQGAEPDPVPEDPGPATTGTWARTTGTTRWAGSRCSASPTPSRSAPTPRTGPGPCHPEMPFEVLAHHAVDFWLCGEDLPQPENRVTLENDGQIRLTLDEKNNVEGLKRLRHELQRRLGDLGMHEKHLLSHSIYMHKGMPIGATAHQAGTIRFGTDPASSALDVNCRAHEVDNLYVVDTSFFPSIGAVNPSLTAIANALRVGDHVLRTTRLSPPDTHTTDRRTCHGCGSRGRAGHLRSDRRPRQAGDLPGAGRPGGAGRPEGPHRRGRQERVGPRPVPRLRRRSPCVSTAWTRMRRRRARCSACCATSTAISTTRRPTPRCRDEMGSGTTGPVLPRGAAVPVRPHRRGHLGGRPGRRRPGDGGEALRERPRRRARRSTRRC